METGIIVGIITALSGILLAELFTPFLDDLNPIKRYKKTKKWRDDKIKRLRLSSDSKDDILKLIESNSFITPMGQTEGPHDRDDLIVRSKDCFDLVDNLLKVFYSKEKYPKPKRYAILGGSGMGKTTFAVYLFVKYITKTMFSIPKRDIHFINLSDDNALCKIEELKKDGYTDDILLLEALDENNEAVKNCKGYLEKLERTIYTFKYAIVISRTQLFPREDRVFVDVATPETITKLEYVKIFISPFSDKETKDYINKKYEKQENSEAKKQEAQRIIDNSADLMCRPMILAHIDDLINLNTKEFLTSAIVYHTIIDKWFQRELERDFNRNICVTEKQLFEFSKRLAYHIYSKWENGSKKGLCIPYAEYKSFLMDNVNDILGKDMEGLILDNDNNSDEELLSLEGRSLINKDGKGNIKFSHKSFFEFFIAIKSTEEPWLQINPDGLDTAVQFAKDMQKAYLSEKTDSLSFVNFYKPNFYHNESNDSYSDELYKSIKIMIKDNSLIEDRNSVLYYKLFDLWEDMLRRLPVTLQKISDKDSPTKNMENLSEVLLNTQNMFSKVNKDGDFLFWDMSMAYFKKGINLLDLKSISKGIRRESYPFKETVFQPLLSTNELLVEMNINHYLFIGHGIASEQELFNYVNEIIRKKKTNNCICIFVEESSIKQQATYMYRLITNIENKPDLLLFIIPYNGKRIYYIVSKNSMVSEDNILDYFKGMSDLFPQKASETVKEKARIISIGKT